MSIFLRFLISAYLSSALLSDGRTSLLILTFLTLKIKLLSCYWIPLFIFSISSYFIASFVSNLLEFGIAMWELVFFNVLLVTLKVEPAMVLVGVFQPDELIWSIRDSMLKLEELMDLPRRC